MLWPDIERSFSNCVVYSKSLGAAGIIRGMDQVRTTRRNEELDPESDDDVLYLVEGLPTSRVPPSDMEFLYAPPELGWCDSSGVGEAVFMYMAPIRQWKKGLCRTRVRGYSPRVLVNERGTPVRIQADHTAAIAHNHLVSHLAVRYRAKRLTPPQVARHIHDSTRTRGVMTKAVHPDVALSGMAGGHDFLVWYQNTPVATFHSGKDTPFLFLPKLCTDFQQVLEEHFNYIRTEE